MRIISATILALALGLPITASVASAASIVGSWSGRGTIRLKTGQVEPVSCRITYEKGDDKGKTFILQANCASTAGTFEQSGRVVKRSASRYSGRLYSDQYAVSGNVSISVNGSRQTVHVSSPNGSGSLKLKRR